MVDKTQERPVLPPPPRASVQSLYQWGNLLTNQLTTIFQDRGYRLNALLDGDTAGKEIGSLVQYEDDGSGNPVIDQPNMPELDGSPILEQISNTNGRGIILRFGSTPAIPALQLVWIPEFELVRQSSTLMQADWTYPAAFDDPSPQNDVCVLPSLHESSAGTGYPDMGPFRFTNFGSSARIYMYSGAGTFADGETLNVAVAAFGLVA